MLVIDMANVPKHLRKEYDDYIRSLEWKKKRMEFIHGNETSEKRSRFDDPESRFLCDICGWNWRTDEIQVHHLHYHTLKREQRQDVLVVFEECHGNEDVKRAERGRERSFIARESARYDAGFETWITKRYGDGAIEYYHDDELEHERFQDFLDRNEGW